MNWLRTLSYVGKKSVSLALGGPIAVGLSAGGDLLSFWTENLDKIKGIDPENLKAFVNESNESEQNIIAVIIFSYAIYSIFRVIRHSKELKMALKENRLKTYSGKVDREFKREMVAIIILIFLSTLYYYLF